MSQRSEKLHRQVAQLRADVDALQVAWLSQQHCDAVELAAAAERTRQAHRRASEAQRTARAWKLNAILTLILAALIAGVALVISAKATTTEPATPSAVISPLDNGRLSGDDTPAQEPLRLDQAHVLENVTVTHYDCCVECCGKVDGLTASGTHATPYSTVNGSTFRITDDGNVKEILPTIFHPDTLDLNSLDALVTMVRTEASEMDAPLYIAVPDCKTVRCFGQSRDYDERCFRQVYYEAHATDVPGWEAKTALGFEEAQIALRTRFQETPDTLYAMKLVSDISLGAKVIYNDNGIATTITTQKGVALQTNEQIRPLVKLRPYRTFQEVEQPESIFLIRVSDRGISFIEADGGMWRLTARETIKKYLEGRLEQEVSEGSVHVVL